MLLASLRQQVLRANQEIARRGLAPHTFGNASGIDRSGVEPFVVIKPSGVDYDSLTPGDMVVTNLDGKSSKAHCVRQAISTRTPVSIVNSLKSAASSTLIPSSLPPGLRPAAPFPALAQPTPTTSTAPFP